MAEYHETEGDTLFLHLGIFQYFMPVMIITRDPRNVEYMLKTKFDNYPKGATFRNSVHELLGDGIFNADGDLWFKQRKTASQMFTANRFKNHIWRVVQKNCQKMLDILSENQEPVVDMFNLLNRFTLDSIGEIGFGTSIGSLENPVSPFLRSFDEAQRIVFRRFVLPGWRASKAKYAVRTCTYYKGSVLWLLLLEVSQQDASEASFKSSGWARKAAAATTCEVSGSTAEASCRSSQRCSTQRQGTASLAFS